MHICRYLVLTRDQGIILDPQDGKYFEVSTDTGFVDIGIDPQQ
jgi:hypothetical protein